MDIWKISHWWHHKLTSVFTGSEQYIAAVLLIMWYKVVLTLEPVDEIPKCIIIQMKATEQYFPVVLYIMLYKVVLTFESVDKNLS